MKGKGKSPALNSLMNKWAAIAPLFMYLWTSKFDGDDLLSDVGTDVITVTGKDFTARRIPATTAATFAVPNMAAFISADTDNYWISGGNLIQRTGADLIVCTSERTIIAYNDYEPYHVYAIGILKPDVVLTEALKIKLNKLFRLWALYWDETFMDSGYMKDNREMESASTYWSSRYASDLILTVISDTEIDGSFTINGDGQDGYKVYISSDNGATYTLKETLIGSANTFQATGLTADAVYYIYVKPYKGTNIGSSSNIQSERTEEKWYLAEGILPANVAATYEAVGAPDLASSYVNKNNPGTNNAAPGSAPDFDSTSGWSFDGIGKFLTTGVIPVNDQTWSMIIRFSDWTPGANQTLAGVYESATKQFRITLNSTLNSMVFANGGQSAGVAPAITNGVLAFAGNKIFVNGVKSLETIPAGTGAITYDVYCGQVHYSSGSGFINAKEQAVGIYNIVLSDIQIVGVRQRMLALSNNNKRKAIQYIKERFGALVCLGMPSFSDLEVEVGNKNVESFALTGLNVDQWLDAIEDAGMRTAILTTKHHDGFMLWDSAQAADGHTPYSIARTSWYAANQIDIVEEFTTKTRARGLKVGLYFSIWDKTHEIRTGTDETTDAAGYIAMIQAQLTELLTNYGRIDVLWLDGWLWQKGYEEIPFATIYNFAKAIQPNCVVIDNRGGSAIQNLSDVEVYEFVPVGGIPATNTLVAEACNTIRNDGKWFYHSNLDQTATTLYTSVEVKAAIVETNSRFANYLLGLAPGTNGLLPDAQVTLLNEIGT
jgi:hypothetical protein